MKLRTTIVLEYDVDDATLVDAFGTDDPAGVAAAELRNIEDGGDYVFFVMSESSAMTVSVEPA